MEFLNINQYMNTNMRKKMLKNIYNKLDLSEIKSKTENNPDYVFERTHISISNMGVKAGCSLKTYMPAKNDRCICH